MKSQLRPWTGLPYGLNLEFVGDITFQFPGMSLDTLSFNFQLLPCGVVKFVEAYTNDIWKKEVTVYVREIYSRRQ